jgi:hypothetical protein
MFCPVLTESQIDLIFLLDVESILPLFFLTRTGPGSGLTFQIYSGFITMIIIILLISASNIN